ncbi:MAG: hypothetical protein UR39_C0001G0021 [Candidatus Woesebacteria bacterium GW2011_GWA1_33_30]|uniref:Uncharacterized protein n=1 Tax=Candidatus Woesebacteria bacterium GW2011_GWA2_33_28 TaxID=1618561 RepID=A0A0G0AAB5_9BACT|nr:MAG: hypothetical protein UR38_C0001G0022 [Candidatus Woesebacteria bacterium GW2011_GWA2_33_28]KKP48988.1 MAG: hypothetical protein UR39_C0001G0021 [Candidatus Woesebacteria bacterium GW2011_GWA1_33_30]KKP49904.1 MAG: hypothetical protein UR40_C0003G0076 [Microgenomates group bacterium GW2011_GWC1_33_32]KKP52580.1 MAG: hypothetical protein UR44_C0001G0022 [Candidatus Woesebacteria bacterium GW2011_GWB1_33_38]
MKYFDSTLNDGDIKSIHKEYGDYVKITADLKNERIVVGCELHADGEKILLDKGGLNDDIWGGGIDFISKKVSTTAVLNIRSRLSNDSMEILDPKRRNLFIKLIEDLFKKLWL